MDMTLAISPSLGIIDPFCLFLRNTKIVAPIAAPIIIIVIIIIMYRPSSLGGRFTSSGGI